MISRSVYLNQCEKSNQRGADTEMLLLYGEAENKFS